MGSRQEIIDLQTAKHGARRLIRFSDLPATAVPYNLPQPCLDVSPDWGPGIVFWQAIDCAGSMTFEHAQQGNPIIYAQSFGASQRGSFFCDGQGGQLLARINFVVSSAGNGAVNAQTGFINTGGTAVPSIRAAFYPASHGKKIEEGGWNQSLLWSSDAGAVAVGIVDGTTRQLFCVPGFNRRFIAYSAVPVQFNFGMPGAVFASFYVSNPQTRIDEVPPPGTIVQVVNASGSTAPLSVSFMER